MVVETQEWVVWIINLSLDDIYKTPQLRGFVFLRQMMIKLYILFIPILVNL
jgi:hypothetical protein